MEIDTVRVTPGMLPPTMRMTPNSPSVWAKLRITPVSTPAHASGRAIRRKVPSRETPRHHDASTKRRSTPANAAENGRTANQYARGNPRTNKITVVHDANCTLSQSASKSMIILPEAEAVPAQNRPATFTEHKIAQCLGRTSILRPRQDYPALLPARIRIK